MRKAFILSIVCLMILAFSGITFGQDVVKIGLTAPITGNYAEFGENFQYAVQLAADIINEQGGIRGRMVEIVVRDSQGVPSESASIATEFVQNRDIVAQIGDFTSTCCLAAAPIFERAGMVQLSPTSSHPDFAPSGRYMFGVVGTQASEGPFNVEFLAQEYMGIESVGVIYINNDWGDATQHYFVEAANEKGLEVTAIEPFFEGERDFTAILTSLRRDDPEGLYVVAMYNEGSLIARQARRMGWDVKFLGPSSLFSEQFITLGEESVEGFVTNTFFALDDPNPEVQAFIEEFRARADRFPNLHAACAYDSMMILADAIERAGFDRSDIRDALAETQDFPGITGSLTFTEVGDIVRQYMVMVVENGAWEVKADYMR